MNDLFSQVYENNPESQMTKIVNAKSFSGQNRKLFELLMSGKRISFAEAYIVHGISDCHRRKKDLVDIHKFQISDEFIPGTRNKVYFMSPSQITFNSLK